MKKNKINFQFLFVLCSFLSCIGTKSTNTEIFETVSIKRALNVDSLTLNDKNFIRREFVQDSIVLVGFWCLKEDSLFFIPESRISKLSSISPMLFAVLRDDVIFTPGCTLGFNSSLLGLQYPLYVSCNKSKDELGRYAIAHKLHDYADVESDTITEAWLSQRIYEIDLEGKIISMSGDFSRDGVLYCYD